MLLELVSLYLLYSFTALHDGIKEQPGRTKEIFAVLRSDDRLSSRSSPTGSFMPLLSLRLVSDGNQHMGGERLMIHYY